jgi:hypothetical protein
MFSGKTEEEILQIIEEESLRIQQLLEEHRRNEEKER